MFFLETSVEDLISIKKNITYCETECIGDVRDNGNKFDFWQLAYVEKGCSIEYCGNKPVSLSEGEFLFHAPKEFSKTVNKGENAFLHSYYISFKCTSKAMDFFRGYKGKVSENTKPYLDKLISEGRSTFVNSQFKNYVIATKKENALLGGFQMYILSLEAFIISVLREEFEKNSELCFDSKEALTINLHSEITEYLQSKIYNRITLDELCKKFNYGKTYICTKFREIEGKSIISYYNEMKIDEACKIIRENNKNLADISNLLKFENQYYFSKVFKKYKGISPSEYKKLHNN